MIRLNTMVVQQLFIYGMVFLASSHNHAAVVGKKEDGSGCICPVATPPGNRLLEMACIATPTLKKCIELKAQTARWMTHTLSWGTVSTLAPNNDADATTYYPFGNIYSYVDGSCATDTGTPYFYGSEIDPTFQQAKTNPTVSFSLSEASYDSVNGCSTDVGGSTLAACAITPDGSGDPENPPCGRLTLIGKFVLVDATTEEYKFAKDALFERHPAMAGWPAGHEWLIAKIEVEEAWTISYYGEATVLSAKDYYGVDSIMAGGNTAGSEL